MATFYLLNTVRVGTYQMTAGDLIDDSIDDVTAIATAGGVLWPSSDSGVAVAAAQCQKLRKQGQSGAVLDAIMSAALDASQLAGSSKLGLFASTLSATGLATDASITPRTLRSLMVLSHSWGHGNGVSSRLDGFRTSLDHRLRSMGRPVRMIGTQFEQCTDQTSPPSLTNPHAFMSYGWHEGHGGIDLATMATNLAGYIATAGVGAPDLAVVLLGTNDAASLGNSIHSGSITQGQAIATMTAGLTSIFNQLVAAGTQRVFVCDVAPLAVPSVSGTILADCNALIAAWNAALPGILAGFGSRAVPIVGLNAITAADFVNAADHVADGHPNRRCATQIGILIAETVAAYIHDAPSGHLPRRVTKGGPATPSIVLAATTDGVSLNHANLKPPGAGSFCLSLDFTPTALPAGVHNIYQYADAVANGFAIRANGATLEVNIANATCIAGWPLQVGVPVRITFWADAATGWVMLAINGVVVNAYALGAAWSISVSQSAYLGYVTPVTTAGAVGSYQRVEMRSGALLPAFADAVRWIEADALESGRIPGLTGELLLSEGTGAPAETLSTTAATMVGSAAWAAAGAYPRASDDGGADLCDQQPIGNVSSLAVGAGAPAAGVGVDFASSVGGMRYPAIAYSALLALPTPPAGTVYHCSDATMNVDVYNAGTPAAPVWRPVGGGVIASEITGFVSGATPTNFYQGPAATGTGVTAAAGTWTILLRRNTNFTIAVDEIFGCCTASIAAGAMIILQNAGSANDVYKADITNVIQSTNTVNYWQSVLNANVTTGTGNGARGNLMLLSLVFGAGTSILYVNGVPGTTNTTAGYVETGTRVCLGGLGIDGSYGFGDGSIVGVAVSTSSLSAAQVQAIMLDVGRLGPEGALLNSPLLTYAYLAKNAGATLASVVGSGNTGGGGPTLTRTGTLPVVPFVAPAWGLAA